MSIGGMHSRNNEFLRRQFGQVRDQIDSQTRSLQSLPSGEGNPYPVGLTADEVNQWQTHQLSNTPDTEGGGTSDIPTGDGVVPGGEGYTPGGQYDMSDPRGVLNSIWKNMGLTTSTNDWLYSNLRNAAGGLPYLYQLTSLGDVNPDNFSSFMNDFVQGGMYSFEDLQNLMTAIASGNVSEFMTAQLGQEGGPDSIIDPANPNQVYQMLGQIIQAAGFSGLSLPALETVMGSLQRLFDDFGGFRRDEMQGEPSDMRDFITYLSDRGFFRRFFGV